ncbi:nucleotide-diphospho-sugar transferase [Hysterangium stoloniferum]|nr:nucleotide-diphospho-sugar transferase [Hysterangium stoloniferum]
MSMVLLRARFLPIWIVVASSLLFLFALNRSGPSYLKQWKSGGTASDGKPNAVIVMLVAPSRMTQAVVSIRNIEDRFNRRLKYPYVILTEATITDELRDKLNYVTEGRGTFASLPEDMWGPPSYLDQAKMDEAQRTLGFTLGYRSMCRFYSGFFWKHPAIAKYDWLWRLDSDIEFHCDVPYDPIAHVRDAGAKYGFVQISNDADWVQPSLAGNVSMFMASHEHLIPTNANHRYSWKDVNKAFSGTAGTPDATMLAFYNNWEISHRSLWTSDLYTAFFEYLDRAGGFFYERWGDSLVHAYAVSMSLQTHEVMQFTDMGYEHQHWPFECPPLNRCTCIRDSVAEEFNNRGYEWFNITQ